MGTDEPESRILCGPLTWEWRLFQLQADTIAVFVSAEVLVQSRLFQLQADTITVFVSAEVLMQSTSQ